MVNKVITGRQKKTNLKNREMAISRDQNYWHLTCIQTASLGVPGIILSPILAKKCGLEATLSSILISSLILWVIGFAISSMAIESRLNAIENAQAYIGTYGAKLVAFISLVGFPIWFSFQLHVTTNYFLKEISGGSIGYSSLTSLIFGAVLGILISLSALGKTIELIKKLNTYFLPILLIYYLHFLFHKIGFASARGIKFSAFCTISYIGFLFPGMVNLPTFFRHARSRYDCYIALNIIVLVVLFFHISSLWASPSILEGNLISYSLSMPKLSIFLLKILNLVFLLGLVFCSNLVNIYFAGPSWENIFYKFKSHIRFFLIGLVSTILFVFTKIFPKIYQITIIINELTDNVIADLGLALVFIFVVRMIVRHRPKKLEKFISCSSWLVGAFFTVQSKILGYGNPLLVGLGMTALFFLFAFFIEEPFWSFKKLNLFILKNKDQKPS